MPSTFASHLLGSALLPEILFVAIVFTLAALILFALAVEAGTYPEVKRSYQRLRKSMDQLSSHQLPQYSSSARDQVAGR